MSESEKLDAMRLAAIAEASEYEKWSKIALVVTCFCELGGGVAVLVLMDWGDPTHRLIFAATLLVYLTLAMFQCTIALWRQAGDQRILQAVQMLEKTVADLASKDEGTSDSDQSRREDSGIQ